MLAALGAAHAGAARADEAGAGDAGELGLAGGLVVFDLVDLPAKDPGRELKFSEKMACPNEHPIDTDELEPRSFSFNSPFGACPECHGLGTRMEVDPELVVTDPSATINDGVISPWTGAHVADYFLGLLRALGSAMTLRPDLFHGRLGGFYDDLRRFGRVTAADILAAIAGSFASHQDADDEVPVGGVRVADDDGARRRVHLVAG